MKLKLFTAIIMFFSFSLMANAQDYNFGFEVYGVEDVNTFFNDDYLGGTATKLEPNSDLKRGDVIAVGVSYEAAIANDAIGFQLGINYNSNMVTPYKESNMVKFDFNKDTLGLSSWTMVVPNDVNSQILSILYDGTLNPITLDSNGLLYFVYFTVKDDATFNELFAFSYDEEFSLGADITATERVLTTTPVSYNVLSYDASLINITIDGTTIEGFASETTSYDITLPYIDNDIIELGAVATTGASITETLGNISLNTSEEGNTVTINVTAEDGVATKTYTLNIKREKNSDNSLLGISILGVDGVWNNTTNKFDVFLGDTIESFLKTDISLNLPEGAISVILENEFNLSFGDNEITFTVTSENGTVENHSVNVNRAYRTDATLSEITLNGTLLEGFDKNTYTYNLEVDNDISAANINAVTTDSSATIEGINNYVLNAGPNSFKLTVTAHDNIAEQVYTININRAFNADVGLTSLSILGNNMVVNNSRYEVTLPHNVDTFATSDVTYTIAPTSNIDITNLPTMPLVYGDNEYVVTVTAEDKTTQDYTIYVIRSYKTDSSLSDIKIDTNSLEGFDKDTLEYTLNVPHETTSIDVQGTTSDSDATITTGLGNHELMVGNNEIDVTVRAHDGTTTSTYTVTVVRAGNNDSTITSVTVESNNAIYNAEKARYEYNVPRDKTSINKSDIVVTPTDTNASVDLSTIDTSSLNYGENLYTFTVTAENNVDKTIYTLVIIKTLNNDTTLSSIAIDGELLAGFTPSNYSYTVSVPYETTEIELTATTSDTNAGVSGTGSKQLAVGLNTYNLIVTGQDGTTATYIVNITRFSNDNTLTTLSILEQVAVWDETNSRYNVTVDTTDKSFTETDVEMEIATTASADKGVGMNLVYGDNNYSVSVTSQNGEEVTYNVVITRPYRTDATLSDIKSNDVTLTDFSKDKLTYTINVANDVTSIKINATPTDSSATIEETLGDINLNVGTNPITITVTAHDGLTEIVYTVNVIRASSSDNTLSGVSILGYDATWSTENSRFEVTLPHDTTTFSGSDVVGQYPATATFNPGSGIAELSYGENNYQVKVTSASLEEATYSVLVVRSHRTDATLNDLKINGTTITDFDSSTTEYTLDVANDVTSVNVLATTTDTFATIGETLGDINLTVGENVITITVTAHDGVTEKVYTLRINKTANTDNSITSLTILGHTATWNVDKFEVEVLSTNDSFTADDIIVVVHESATVNKGTGMSLNMGDNNYSITVTAENGTVATYPVVITRPENTGLIVLTTTVDAAHDISDGYIKTVALNKTGLDLKNELLNDNSMLFIFEEDGTTPVADDSVLGTGMIVKLMNGSTELDKASIVIIGDANGDGSISLMDGLSISNHVLERRLVEGAYFIAADTGKNDKIDLSDGLKIINHVLERALLH